MAFNPLSSTETESGKPITTTTMGKVRDNFDDHESRIQTIEGGSGMTYPPIVFRVNGSYWLHGTKTGLIKSTINFDSLLTGVFLIIDTAGSSGTTEIDIKFKRGVGAWTTIFTTKPSVAFGAGNDAISSNGVLDASVSTLQAGDLIRLDTTSVQTNGKGFTVRIDFVGA